MSFWLLPGLDACPDEETAITFEETSDEAAAAAAAADYSSAGEFYGREREHVSPPVVMTEAAAVGSVGGGLAAGECFEGANTVGSVRSILQVRLQSYITIL